MAGNHSPYGTISRGDSSRRRRKRRDDTIRTILAVVLVCVLVLLIGFLGVNALKGNESTNKDNETNSGEEINQDGTQDSNEGETPEATEEQTPEQTEEPTEPENVPVTVAKEHIVWLDAGHGGHDLGGAIWVKDENGNYLDWNGNIVPEASDDGAYKVREKEQTLQLTLLVQAALEERGVTVLMTRTDDTFTDTKERPALANQSDAECFISLHRNFMKGNQQYNGIEVWGVNWEDYNSKPEKAKDQQLAEFIIAELNEEDINGISEVLRNNHTGTFEQGGDDYAVLWRSNMPALILEMGYMSNDSDNEKFEANIESYAIAIADGIVQWLITQE